MTNIEKSLKDRARKEVDTIILKMINEDFFIGNPAKEERISAKTIVEAANKLLEILNGKNDWRRTNLEDRIQLTSIEFLYGMSIGSGKELWELKNLFITYAIDRLKELKGE